MSHPIHRMDQADLPRVLSVVAAAGGTRRTEASWQQDAMTALVLGPREAPGALMPISRRLVQVAPGRVLQAGWVSSNQFASRMGLRRQSRGTEAHWAELLPEIDALLVVRRDEPSLAGRWYSQVGFHEVLAIRCLYLEMDAPPAAAAGRYHVQVVGPEQISTWSNQMAQVYREVFGNYGGAVMRSAPFWGPALADHFYKEHYQFQVIGLWANESLMGYAVVGWSGWHSKRPRMDILELATRQWDTQVAQELIQTTCQLAWGKGVAQVRAVVSVHDPYRPHLARVGFADRWGYAMQAKWLHPQRYLDKAAATEGVELFSPGAVPLHIGPADAQPQTPRVQADPRTLTRLLLQRVDIAAGLRDGSLVAVEAGSAELASSRLSMALPWTPWIFHMLDFI